MLFGLRGPATTRNSSIRVPKLTENFQSRDMERRSEALDARWAVSPDATNGCVVLELTSDAESPSADAFIASLMADYSLA